MRSGEVPDVSLEDVVSWDKLVKKIQNGIWTQLTILGLFLVPTNLSASCGQMNPQEDFKKRDGKMMVGLKRGNTWAENTYIGTFRKKERLVN